jgi:hypothetical protein
MIKNIKATLRHTITRQVRSKYSSLINEDITDIVKLKEIFELTHVNNTELLIFLNLHIFEYIPLYNFYKQHEDPTYTKYKLFLNYRLKFPKTTSSKEFFFLKYGNYHKYLQKNKSISKSLLESDNLNTRESYYLSKGFSEKESKLMVKERQTTFSLDLCIKRYGEIEGTNVFNKRQVTWQNTLKNKSKEDIDAINKSKLWCKNLSEYEIIKVMNDRFLKNVEKGINLDTKMIPDFDIYKRMVWRYTNRSGFNTLPNAHKRSRPDLSSYPYSLDHMFSIKEGFIENIPAYIIGSIHNLEFITYSENSSKQAKCSHTKEELFDLFFT